jgi:hypothetical protein
MHRLMPSPDRRDPHLGVALAALALVGTAPACTPAEEEGALAFTGAGLWMAPASAAVGSARTVLLRGSPVLWGPEVPRVDLGEGVDVAVTEVLGPDTLRLQLVIAPDAALGPRDARVRWGENQAIQRRAFAVESGAVTLSPSRAALGEAIHVEVSGWQTSFLSERTTLSLGAGVEIDDLTVVSPTRLRATAIIDPRTDPGPRDVTVFQGTGDVWTLAQGFFIDRDALAMEIVPDEASQGDLVKVAVRAEAGGFLPGRTTLDLGTGVTVQEIVVRDAERVDATLRIGNNATPGTRDVVARTEGGAGPPTLRVLPDGFTIHPVEADPLEARVSLSFTIARSWSADACDFSESVSASALFYEANDFPCPSSGGSSSLVPPPRYDGVSTGRSIQGGATDCPAPKTFDAGPMVHFVDGEDRVDLVREVNPYTGRVTYRADGLTRADYLPGRAFQLVTEGGDLGWSELPPWTIEQAIRTLPRHWELVGPDLCAYVHPRTEPLLVEWDAAATYDEALLYLTLSGFPDAELGTPVAMVYPWDDGEWTFEPDILSFFPAGGASLVASAYIMTRFAVPGSTVVNSGFGNSTIFHRGGFVFE